jgi:O-antigen/teichoic acid export membrane protein
VKIWFIVKREKDFPILPKVDAGCCKDIIQMGLRSYFAGLSTRIASIADKIFIFNVLGKDMSNVYNIACRIPQILLEAFGKIAESVTPEMAHVAENEPSKLADIFKRNFKFIGFVAAVGIMFVSGFGDVIQRVWLNKDWDNFATIVFIMGIYYGLELHHSTITRVFFAQGKPQLMLPFSLWNSVITLTMTSFLARRFGLLGPAAMNLFIDLAQIVPIHYYCSRYGVKEISTKELLKISFTILMPGAVFGALALFAFSQVTPGRWFYIVILLIPVLCLLLGAFYRRVGLLEFPGGLEKMIGKFAILRKLLGVVS